MARIPTQTVAAVTLLWDTDTGEVKALAFADRLRLVEAGHIVWCEHHQCFHYVQTGGGHANHQLH